MITAALINFSAAFVVFKSACFMGGLMTTINRALFVTDLPYVQDLASTCARNCDFACETMLSDGTDLEAVAKKVTDENILLVLSHGDLAAALRPLLPVTLIEIPSDYIALCRSIENLRRQGCKKIFILMPSIDNLKLRSTVRSVDPQDNCEISVLKIPTSSEYSIAIGDALLNGIDGIAAPLAMIKKVPAGSNIRTDVIGVSETAITRLFEAAKRIMHLEKVKRLQLTRLELLINNITEGVIIFNRDKDAVFHNAQADRILHGVRERDMYPLLEPMFEKTRYNTVVTINNRQVLMNTMHFVFPNTDIDNHVVIMQEGTDIEKSERTLRSHNITKGLIARNKFSTLIGEDPKTRAIIEQAKRFARTESTVILYGETGVGKEVFAQSIHNESPRKAEAFVSVNCAVLPPSLIESELFGYVEGAFTGARSKGKKGLFEMAHRGTIFLDEIGELPLDMQSRLLRVLQEREIMRIGDNKLTPVDVRVICATNRNLMEQCSEGKFRTDLYYRINVLRLNVPPLRERRGDIIPLFTAYLERFFGNKDFVLEEGAQDLLLSYSWPGNIRELRNTAEACVLDGPRVTRSSLLNLLQDLDDGSSRSTAAAAPDPLLPDNEMRINLNELTSLKDLERRTLQGMLKIMSQDEICKRLSFSKVTLWRKLKE